MRLILFSIIFLISTFMGCGGDNHGDVNQSLTYETNKRAIKSVAEIKNDLKGLTLEAIVGEQGYLEKMALEYEEYFGQSIGNFAGRIILINRDLIILLKCKLSIQSRKIRENNIFTDLERLNREINREIRESPKNDLDKLGKLYSFLKANEKLRDEVEFISKNFKDLEKLIKENAEIAKTNEELTQYNQKLKEEKEALKLRVDTLTIRILAHELAKSIVLPGAPKN